MKNKYGIGFFAAAIIAVLAVSSAYQLSYQKAKERAQTQVTKEQEEPADVYKRQPMPCDEFERLLSKDPHGDWGSGFKRT